MRGSNPDAALYWFARMLDGGCDPLYIARRVVRMASEEVGNADPRALGLCLSAWDVQERLGSPEGELAVAQAIVYLACAPKSNAVYSAFNAAMRDVAESGSREVPLHLRNAPTKLMKSLGYGEEYRYAQTSRMPMPPERIISPRIWSRGVTINRCRGPGTEDPRQAGTPGRAGSHQSPPTQKILSGMGSAELARLPRRRR